jgi:hypothetical protein
MEQSAHDIQSPQRALPVLVFAFAREILDFYRSLTAILVCKLPKRPSTREKPLHHSEPKRVGCRSRPEGNPGRCSVTLGFVVGTHGVAHDIRVSGPLSPDFDAASVETVKTWKFSPATKVRKPVPMEAAVQISLHLPRPQSRVLGVPSQKLSTIQTLLPTVGAGIATYLPLREGIAQVAWKFFTCQSACAFPIKSTYNRVDRRPLGLLETKKPFPSAAQSSEVKLFQPLTVISRVGLPKSEIN